MEDFPIYTKWLNNIVHPSERNRREMFLRWEYFYTKYFNSHLPPLCKIEKWKEVLELLTNLKSFPSNFLAFVNTTVLAGMLRPRANVSVAKRA